MQSYQIAEAGKSPRLVETRAPVAGRNEVLLAVKSCGLNFADLLMVKGKYQEMPSYPFALGMEFAGEIVAVGEDIDSIHVGNRVAAFAGHGGLAENICVPFESCVFLPDAMSMPQAAGFQIAYGTSHLALSHRAKLQPGETLVVLGASGGVGLTAVEIGKAMGANVIGVARGADKCAVVASAGADHVLDYETDDLRDAIRGLGGADVVYDAVGGDQFKAALRACNPEARILAIGFASGDVPQIPANILLVKNITVIGFYWGGYLKFAPEVLRKSMAELFTMFEQGKLSPQINHIYPLEQAADALALLENRQATGKVVVEISAG